MQMKIVVKDFTASFPIQKASTWTEMCDSSTNDENFFETANLSCFLLPNAQGWPICPTVNLFGNPRADKANWSHVPTSDELCQNSLVGFQINQPRWNSDQKK